MQLSLTPSPLTIHVVYGCLLVKTKVDTDSISELSKGFFCLVSTFTVLDTYYLSKSISVVLTEIQFHRYYEITSIDKKDLRKKFYLCIDLIF